MVSLKYHWDFTKPRDEGYIGNDTRDTISTVVGGIDMYVRRWGSGSGYIEYSSEGVELDKYYYLDTSGGGIDISDTGAIEIVYKNTYSSTAAEWVGRKLLQIDISGVSTWNMAMYLGKISSTRRSGWIGTSKTTTSHISGWDEKRSDVSGAEFRHIVRTWDRSAAKAAEHKYELYSDAVEENTTSGSLGGEWEKTSSPATTATVTADIKVHFHGNNGYMPWRGTIQYIKIYDSYKSSGEVTNIYNNYIGSSSGNACFLGNTKVKTDQGIIAFNQLTKHHSILNNKIQKVVKVINSDDTMVFIKKHALGKGVPNKNTYISRNHGIYINHILVRARNLVNGNTIQEHKMKKQAIYNVLLSQYGVMYVNNIPCESLNPNDPMVHKYIK